jgi:hypothetical protein
MLKTNGNEIEYEKPYNLHPNNQQMTSQKRAVYFQFNATSIQIQLVLPFNIFVQTNIMTHTNILRTKPIRNRIKKKSFLYEQLIKLQSKKLFMVCRTHKCYAIYIVVRNFNNKITLLYMYIVEKNLTRDI